jgi:glycosyltransferase involved in cell wall biosynthesis
LSAAGARQLYVDSAVKTDKTMQLDVIVPTYNRQELLRRTLDSLLAAGVPRGLSVRVTVVDNNSKDGTKQVVEEQMEKFEGRLAYLFEGRPGKSYALNTGIAATTGQLVGMIDDDEEIDVGWYARVEKAFSDDEVDFIGGPYVPRWGAEPPDWLPKDYLGVIGWVDSGDEVLAYGKDFPGILMGGNAVVKRSMLEKVGPYSTSLGPTDKLLLRGEDDDMYHRLLAAGARGFYLPDLRIHHYIPPERLTKKYYRRWCFWRGVGMGMLDKDHRQAVVYLCGVPRWLYGRAAQGLIGKLKSVAGRQRDLGQSFSHELAVWDLAGFFYGKHFYRGAR